MGPDFYFLKKSLNRCSLMYKNTGIVWSYTAEPQRGQEV